MQKETAEEGPSGGGTGLRASQPPSMQTSTLNQAGLWGAHAWGVAKTQLSLLAPWLAGGRSSGPAPALRVALGACTRWGGLIWSSQSLDKQAKNSKNKPWNIEHQYLELFQYII